MKQQIMQLNFSKMHGLGNDFMVIETLSQAISLERLSIASLANRHTGVGFDQLLWITPSSKADFACRFFNADGSEAEQCGNGLRCIARFLHEHGFTQKKSFTLETLKNIIPITLNDYDTIEVEMPLPSFSYSDLPCIESLLSELDPHLTLLSVGNPHAILQVSSLEHAPVSTLGKEIATHSAFPKGINVGFMEILARNSVRLRTYERGVGETFACGTNACAAVIAGIHHHRLDHQVEVVLPLGKLSITWNNDMRTPPLMKGPASEIFTGTLLI